MTEQKKTLANRIAEIMGTIGNVEKKGKISSQGSGPSYNFATDPDVLRTVIPKLSDEGIVLVPEQVEVLSIEPNMRGTQLIASIRTHWLVTDGTEELRLQSLGMGQDSGDKALPKAQTNARKYALFMLLHIVTGDDPDQWSSDADAHRPPVKREPTAGELREQIAVALHEKGRDHAYLEKIGKAIGAGKPASREHLAEMLRLVREGWQEPIEQPGERAQASEALPAEPATTPATTPGSSVPTDSPATEAPASEGTQTSEIPTDGGLDADVVAPEGVPPSSSGAPTLEDVLAVSGGELVPDKPDYVKRAEARAAAAKPKNARAPHEATEVTAGL